MGAAIALGAANAVVFLLFEGVVNRGTDLIWNDWLQTDTSRWLVVPVAIILSIGFSWLLRLMRQPRWIKPEVNLDLSTEALPDPSLRKVGSVLTTGAAGLLAGASLGPEMPLTEGSHALGSWARSKLRITPEQGAALIAASIGALMVAFFGSLILVVLPFLLLLKTGRRPAWPVAGLVVLAALASYGTLRLLDHRVHGYGDIPAVPPAALHDYLGAIVVGLCVSAAALLLVRSIGWLGQHNRVLAQRLPWYGSAALFGLVLGGLYLVGGQAVQFSGSGGIGLLLSEYSGYSAWALLGIAAVKLLATVWSKTTGYRGGLFFPSIFVGVTLSLWLDTLFDALAGPGLMIGAIAAIFMALSIPDKPGAARREYLVAALIAFLFMAAIVPAKLIPLVLVAIMAAGVGNGLLVMLRPAKTHY